MCLFVSILFKYPVNSNIPSLRFEWTRLAVVSLRYQEIEHVASAAEAGLIIRQLMGPNPTRPLLSAVCHLRLSEALPNEMRPMCRALPTWASVVPWRSMTPLLIQIFP